MDLARFVKLTQLYYGEDVIIQEGEDTFFDIYNIINRNFSRFLNNVFLYSRKQGGDAIDFDDVIPNNVEEAKHTLLDYLKFLTSNTNLWRVVPDETGIITGRPTVSQEDFDNEVQTQHYYGVDGLMLLFCKLDLENGKMTKAERFTGPWNLLAFPLLELTSEPDLSPDAIPPIDSKFEPTLDQLYPWVMFVALRELKRAEENISNNASVGTYVNSAPSDLKTLASEYLFSMLSQYSYLRNDVPEVVFKYFEEDETYNALVNVNSFYRLGRSIPSSIYIIGSTLQGNEVALRTIRHNWELVTGFLGRNIFSFIIFLWTRIAAWVVTVINQITIFIQAYSLQTLFPAPDEQ